MSIDVKKDFKHLYHPPLDRFVEVEVPEFTYLSIDGHGDPNTSRDYAAAVEGLYTSGYAVRAAVKKRTGTDFVVGPLEGLWSSPDPADFVAGNKGNWDWTMLIPLPSVVLFEDTTLGLTAAAAKKGHLPIGRIRRLTLIEGLSLQIMHLGPYDDEAPVLARLHRQVMPERGLTWNGRHHEIYLSDPRRTPADKLKTVLRQPVVAAARSTR